MLEPVGWSDKEIDSLIQTTIFALKKKSFQLLLNKLTKLTKVTHPKFNLYKNMNK